MTRKPFFVLACAALAVSAAQAQQTSGLSSGVTAGYYFPSYTLVKNAFGSSVFNYGIGGASTNRPSSGSITPDLLITTANANGNKLFIATYTEGYEYHLGKANANLAPYARGFGGLSYFDFGIDLDNGGRESIKRVGYTYGAEAGLVFMKRFRLSARYNIYSKEDAFSFNGYTVGLTWALW